MAEKMRKSYDAAFKARVALEAVKYLLQDKNGESCKTKMEKVAIGNSIKLQNPLQA
jgi:hypothetical protein